MNPMKPRNHAFDFLCGICIIRMVSLHIMAFCGHADDDWWREVMQWTYYFMSFFFFKAGYFNKSVLGDSRKYCSPACSFVGCPWVLGRLFQRKKRYPEQIPEEQAVLTGEDLPIDAQAIAAAAEEAALSAVDTAAEKKEQRRRPAKQPAPIAISQEEEPLPEALPQEPKKPKPA